MKNTTVYYSIHGQNADRMNRGFWEAVSDVKFRSAPIGSLCSDIYQETITGRGETAKSAINDLIEKLQCSGMTGTLKHISKS